MADDLSRVELNFYFVTFNSDTVHAERYVAILSRSYLEAWDRCEQAFGRTFTLWGPSGWKNWQGLTVAQRRNLRAIGWDEAVAGWVAPAKQPSPYREGE